MVQRMNKVEFLSVPLSCGPFVLWTTPSTNLCFRLLHSCHLQSTIFAGNLRWLYKIGSTVPGKFLLHWRKRNQKPKIFAFCNVDYLVHLLLFQLNTFHKYMNKECFYVFYTKTADRLVLQSSKRIRQKFLVSIVLSRTQIVRYISLLLANPCRKIYSVVREGGGKTEGITVLFK